MSTLFIAKDNTPPLFGGKPGQVVVCDGEHMGTYNHRGSFVYSPNWIHQPAQKDQRPKMKQVEDTTVDRKRHPEPNTNLGQPSAQEGFSSNWVSDHPVHRLLSDTVREYPNGQLWCSTCRRLTCEHISIVMRMHSDAIDVTEKRNIPYTRCQEVCVPMWPGIWDECYAWVREGKLYISIVSMDENWPDELHDKVGALSAIPNDELVKAAGIYVEMIEPTEGRFIMRELIINFLYAVFDQRPTCTSPWHAAPQWTGPGTSLDPRGPKAMRNTLCLLQMQTCWECVTESQTESPF